MAIIGKDHKTLSDENRELLKNNLGLLVEVGKLRTQLTEVFDAIRPLAEWAERSKAQGDELTPLSARVLELVTTYDADKEGK